MNIAELHPRWTVGANCYQRHGMGISFVCPKCRTHRIAIMFSNPVDGGAPTEDANKWERTGDNLLTISVKPSIDATKAQSDCWHGHITNGEIT